MTTTEAKKMISEEFLKLYREWLEDYENMGEREYGKKYGWGRNPEIEVKDGLKAVVMFQKYVFSGRYIQGWKDAGYDSRVIWELKKDGFLSYQYYSNWEARMRGRQDFLYISQKTAKQIYKEG